MLIEFLRRPRRKLIPAGLSTPTAEHDHRSGSGIVRALMEADS
jgi:hypothetical protein